MNTQIAKQQRLNQRKRRIRAKISGTAQHPRVSVARSLRFIYIQFIDDTTGKTLLAATDKTLDVKGTKTERAKALGLALAKQAKEAGITKVVFDRGGRDYHGRIKALAEGLREGGLEF